MKEYLGDAYNENHIINFLNYWMKGQDVFVSYDSNNLQLYHEWRRANDLDCIAKGGDLRADTLVSMWTPIKWVLNCLNPDIKVYKTAKGSDPNCYLRKLRDEYEVYFTSEDDEKKSLVAKLDRLCQLAELECNFILLPGDGRDNGSGMNPERYCLKRDDKTTYLYDQVPCTLYHVFENDTLGKYFQNEDDVVSWIKREHLDVGFNGDISQENIIPMFENDRNTLALGKIPSNDFEVDEMLDYCIDLLLKRAGSMMTNNKILKDNTIHNGIVVYGIEEDEKTIKKEIFFFDDSSGNLYVSNNINKEHILKVLNSYNNILSKFNITDMNQKINKLGSFKDENIPWLHFGKYIGMSDDEFVKFIKELNMVKYKPCKEV